MTTIGHIIVGTAIGVTTLPVMKRVGYRFAFIMAIIAFANIPDWPLPGWGHDRLAFSHSLFVNLVLMGGIVMVLIRFAGPLRTRQHRALLIGGLAGWSSHFLLDMLYGDMGVHILWPLSNAAVSLPIPWLHTMPHVPPPFDWAICKILLLELITFLPVLGMAILIRNHVLRKTLNL